jgi:DNA-binding CsgD family transcriptional regulator/PAS domain-containing protein
MAASSDSLEELALLIGLIYDAALDPSLWPWALERSAGYLGAADAMLFSQDTTWEGRFYFHWNDDPEYTRLFFEKYAKINPITPLLMMTGVGETYAGSRIMPREELTQSQFYREWVVPQDRVDFVATTLDRSAAGVATAFFGRSTAQGLVDDGVMRRMALLAPHLRRAVLIGRVIDTHRTQVAALSDTLDGLASGVFLVDERGAIRYANAAAREMLKREDIAIGPRGVPTPAKGDSDRALREIFAIAGANPADDAPNTIAVPFAMSTGEAHLAHVLPLNSGARRVASVTYGAVAAVFVRKATIDVPTPVEAVARLYNLSPSELRVLYAVVEVGGVPAMAAMLGISEATVKTHLQHLFEKTGASRQIDLVKIVAAHASPLAG